MKAFPISSFIVLTSHLARVLSSPTPTLQEVPSLTGRNVGDTASVHISDTESWTLTVTLQTGSDGDYDDDELKSLGSAFATAVANAPATTDKVTASYTDVLGNGYELDLDLDDGVTIGSKTNADWAVAGTTFVDYTLYQEQPLRFTAKCNDDSQNGTELGFYEFTFTPK